MKRVEEIENTVRLNMKTVRAHGLCDGVTSDACAVCGYLGSRTCYEEFCSDLCESFLAMKDAFIDDDDAKYWTNINRMKIRQELKGIGKYGDILEHNTSLMTKQRIEHLEEELIDALMYCEHLKASTKDGITANEYQRAALRTADANKDTWLENAMFGLVGEVGEVIDLVKKSKFQGHELDANKLANELGDVAWYLALACSAVGLSLGDVFSGNIEKLKKRFPDGFDKNRSINREEAHG